jgi:DNA-binding transcriptional MerR regulator
MFRIGEFSRIARVSARLLRFYDELGLLKPAHADPQTGYRYYSADQLSELNRITVLKGLGFTLEQIGPILANRITATELRSMLLLRRRDAEQSMGAEKERLRQIETRIMQIETGGKLDTTDVVMRSEPERRLLSLRRVVSSFSEARGLLAELNEHVKAIYPRGHSGQICAVAHSEDFETDDIDVEFGMTLGAGEEPRVPAGSPLGLTIMPAAERMATCVRVGPPEDAHLVTAKIGRFIEMNGDSLAGPSREVFLRPPRLDRLHEALVEMQFPLARSQSD